MIDAENAALPPGWAWAKLGDLITAIEAGLNVAAVGRAPNDGETGIVKISAVTWGEFDEKQSKTLPRNKFTDLRLLISEGDFLISRANTLELVGAPVIVKKIHRRLVLSDKVLRLHFKHSLDRWVELYLKSGGGRAQIESRAQGAQLSMRNISQENLRRIMVPIAPDPERQRILHLLDCSLSEIDEVKASMVRARERMADYRASLLHAACTGALTADWRDVNSHPDEDGPALLRCILAERRAAWERAELARLTAAGKLPPGESWTSRYPAPADPRPQLSTTLPPGWTWCRMEQLGSVNTGATPSRSSSEYFASVGIPWITSSEVRTSPIKHAREFITERALAETACKINPAGSLIIALYGEGSTRGRCAILAVEAATNQALAVVRLQSVPEVTLDYVKMVVDRSYLLLRAQAAGGVQPNLSLGIVRDWLIPLPPLAEQVRIMRLLEDSAPDIKFNAEDVAHLRQSILHAAFSGRLVSQDSADEPATTFLARLCADVTPSTPRRRSARVGARP